MTLYTRGSDGFVSSTAALIASGWSEPSSRAGLSPAVVQRLFTAHVLWRFNANLRGISFGSRASSCSSRPCHQGFVVVAGRTFLHRVAYHLGSSQLVKSGRALPGHPGGRVLLTESTKKACCLSLTTM